MFDQKYFLAEQACCLKNQTKVNIQLFTDVSTMRLFSVVVGLLTDNH